jgi:hypothetical protein
MPHLNEDQRNNAIARLQAGETQTHVSRVLNVSQSNLSRLWLALIPASRRRLRTVWCEILRCPGIAGAVDVAVVNLSCK